MPTMYLTQAGELALQELGLPGWTNLKTDIAITAPSPPGRQAVLTDFTVPAWAGYAPEAVVLAGGYVDGSNGPVYAISGQSKFTGPAAGGGSVVQGALLSDGTTHTIWAWFLFDTPLNLVVATDLIAFTIQLYANLSSNVEVIA